jgi:succinoglycan biosynthesis transport protein ExoP
MERGMTLQQVIRGIWRRRRLVALIFAVVFAAGAATVAALPDRYRATAVVRVEPHRPSAELVQPSVTAPVEDRLKTARQELFARPLIERAVAELGLFPDLRKKRGIEAAVDELRAMLDVKIEGETAFELSVVGPDPVQVTRIANRLPELYAQEALLVREAQARDIAALFDEELERISRQVMALEQRINAFKIAHLGELPEQLEPNMRNAERIMAALTARGDARRDIQRHLADASQSHSDADSELGRLQRRALDLSRDRTLARSQWTEDHPEVQRLDREIASVEARRAAAEARAQQEGALSAQLKGQLSAVNTEMATLERELQVYRERLDRTPRWAQELSVTNRDYELLRTKYQSLLSRKVEAEVARDMEAKARASMFHVLSPAAQPRAPFKPDRASGLLLAILAALAAAALTGVFLELQDDSVRDAEAARDISVPVLALVPRIPGEERTGKASR